MERGRIIISNNDLKDYDFNNFERYFEYIIESDINEQFTQVRNLVKVLSKISITNYWCTQRQKLLRTLWIQEDIYEVGLMSIVIRQTYFNTYKECRAFIEQRRNEGCTHITSNKFSDSGRWWVKYQEPTQSEEKDVMQEFIHCWQSNYHGRVVGAQAADMLEC